MAFITNKSEETVFHSWDELRHFSEVEQRGMEIIPLAGFSQHAARFSDDRTFGSSSAAFYFNDPGFAKMCSLLRIPKSVCNRTKRSGIATDLLNDALSREDIKERMKDKQLVLKGDTIVGVVGPGYLGYSNKALLTDLESQLESRLRNYTFTKSYSINSTLHLRMLSDDIRVGIVSGQGGEGVDISKVGLEFRNSMVGDSAIRASVFIHRLVCANGLIVTGNAASGSVLHAGREDTFQSRIDKRITPVFSQMRLAAHRIEQLGDLKFDPERLVDAGAVELIYNMISPSRSQMEERNKLRRKNRREMDIKIIQKLPVKHGGELSYALFTSHWRDEVSMFDFINVFTEFAKKQTVSRRLKLEEQSGNLASWIHENRRKFK